MNLPPAARAVLHALACVPDGLSERALLMVLPPLLPADAPPLPPRPQAILRRLTEQGWLTARPGGWRLAEARLGEVWRDIAEQSWLWPLLAMLMERLYDAPPSPAQAHRQDWLARLQAGDRSFLPGLSAAHAALARLNAEADAAQPAAPSVERRLAWRLEASDGGVELEAREQKRTAQGWTPGRVLSWKRLLGELPDWLSAQDHAALRCAKVSEVYYYGGESYTLDEDALPALVGHPALFAAEPPHARIELSLGQPALVLRQQGDMLRLEVSPPQLTDARTQWLDHSQPEHWRLYRLDGELKRLVALVGHGLAVPRAARAPLLDAISQLAPLLPIHSDLTDLAGQLPALPADATLYALLRADGDSLRVQLRVRPLPGGRDYRPGQGMVTVVGAVDGEAVHTCRDLDAERRARAAVLRQCPTLAACPHDPIIGERVCVSIDQALDVLAELQAVGEAQLRCVWPAGQRLRLRGPAHAGQARLSIRQRGDWFAVNGELALEDDGRLLQLRELLTLVGQHSGRYVRLGEADWLALDDALRQQLAALARASAGLDADGAAQLSRLAAPMLAQLADSAAACEGDAGWTAQRARWQALEQISPAVPSALHATLRDYQLAGFHWLARLAHWGVGACLADDMGLGKTMQTLALCLLRAEHGPQLVVAPTSVAQNWLAEAARFAPSLRLRPYAQQRALDALAPGDLVVVSYGLFQLDAERFAQVHWASVILDEAQAIKNPDTRRAQAAFALRADFRLAASGTPVENHLGELWSLFRFLNPGLLGSLEQFGERFATPIAEGDEPARLALRRLLQPFILRRTKTQVLTELPPRTELTYRVELSDGERELYEALRQEALEQVAQAPEHERAMQVLAHITRLRRLCCHPTLALPNATLPGSKLAAFARLMRELLDNGHKALVFSQFVDHLALARRWLDEQGIAYHYLDGATPARQRQKKVEAFQGGQGEVFLISLKAGGSGLTLTAADYVLHLDPWWNPAVEDQASDRAYRMGQQRPVTIYRLVAAHTIEERILALHAAKRELADALLAGGDASARLDTDALLALLREAAS